MLPFKCHPQQHLYLSVYTQQTNLSWYVKCKPPWLTFCLTSHICVHTTRTEHFPGLAALHRQMPLNLWSTSIPLLFQLEETLLRKGLHRDGFIPFFTLCELLLLSEYKMEDLQIAILWINPFSWKICFSIDLFNPLSFYATWMLSLSKYLYSKHSMYGWLLGLPALQDRGWFPVLHLAQP